MPLNLSNLNAIIEAQLAAADSNTSASSLVRLLSAIEERDIQVIKPIYDSASLLPILESVHTGMIFSTVRSGPHVWTGSEWTIIDSDGLGTLPPPPPYTIGGTVSGYISGGMESSGSLSSIINKFPFASNGNSVTVGYLVNARADPVGISSPTYGYTIGGRWVVNTGAPAALTGVDKFPFAADGNAVHVRYLFTSRGNGHGMNNETTAYLTGGRNSTQTWGNASHTGAIEKFEFASDTDASLTIGNTTGIINGVGLSSATTGYQVGGSNSAGSENIIIKYPFAMAGGYASYGGQLTEKRQSAVGCQSAENGYIVAGYYTTPNNSNYSRGNISKFNFASEGIASNYGGIAYSQGGYGAGSSSETHGFATAGDYITKFGFASEANATSIGNLQASKLYATGQQF